MAKTLRDLVGSNPPLQEHTSSVEAEMGTMLPGSDDPSEHPLERLRPSGHLNLNPGTVRRLWKAGEMSDAEVMEYEMLTGERVRAEPEQPIPDRGGETQPYTGFLGEEIPEPRPSGKKFPVIRRD